MDCCYIDGHDALIMGRKLDGKILMTVCLLATNFDAIFAKATSQYGDYQNMPQRH